MRRTTAFTLVELLIVLGILAVVTAFSWPAVRGLLAQNELRSAAKHVRNALAKARLQAMESGSVRQFRYRPGTGHFEIARRAGAGDEPLSDTTLHLPNASADALEEEEEVLTSGVRFDAPGPAGVSPSSDLSESSLDESWSTPILFFPNGRTSNARLLLHGRRDFLVQLTLRGVTGSVAIGALERAEAEP